MVKGRDEKTVKKSSAWAKHGKHKGILGHIVEERRKVKRPVKLKTYASII